MAVVEVAGELFASVALLEDVIGVGAAAGEIGQAPALKVECALAIGHGLVEFSPTGGDDGEIAMIYQHEARTRRSR